jgi:hypothetical protein
MRSSFNVGNYDHGSVPQGGNILVAAVQMAITVWLKTGSMEE